MHQNIKFFKGVYVLKIYFFRKNVFDLQIVCQSAMFQTVPKTPWPHIDTILTTPAIRHFKKMPAMFNAYQSFSGQPKKKPKKIDFTKSGQ